MCSNNPNIDYYGNVTVGAQGDPSLDDLRVLGFQAILVTVGVQGTKWLGLPGEQFTGVYHAKDVVYFYNKLPPFAQKPYRFGKRCAIVGVGNVMMDIVSYLIREPKVEEVIAVVRRGLPVKFDKKEMEHVFANLDLAVLDVEMARVRRSRQAVGQGPAAAKAMMLEGQQCAEAKTSETRFRFEFLTSPMQMFGDARSYLTQLEDGRQHAALKDGDTKPRGTGNKRLLDVETIVFAIGDKVDETFGLPVEWNEFVKKRHPKFPIDGISFEFTFEDVFVAGGRGKPATGWLVTCGRTAQRVEGGLAIFADPHPRGGKQRRQ